MGEDVGPDVTEDAYCISIRVRLSLSHPRGSLSQDGQPGTGDGHLRSSDFNGIHEGDNEAVIPVLNNHEGLVFGDYIATVLSPLQVVGQGEFHGDVTRPVQDLRVGDV